MHHLVIQYILQMAWKKENLSWYWATHQGNQVKKSPAVANHVHSIYVSIELSWTLLCLAAFGGSCSYSWWDTPRIHVQLKTDQPPCQLMRPRRINNRVETDTYFSLYWLDNDKYIILYLNIVANTLHSSVNGLLMECMCLWTRPTSQGGSLVHGSTSSCKTEVWCWQVQFSF